MEAKVIEYTYEDSEWDACRGTRRWKCKQKAILVETGDKKILIVPYDTRPYFFEVSAEDARGNMNFGWKDSSDMPLPSNGYAVLRKLNLATSTFKNLMNVIEWKKNIMTMRDALEEIFKNLREEKTKG